MFGTYRLLLAVGVIVAHMGVSLYGIHTGVVSVVCFFMVSGYAMTGLINESYPPSPGAATAFYLDRILRLAPQYYFYLVVCAVTVLMLGWRRTTAQSGMPDFINVTANLTVIPLSFWMYSKSIGTFILNMPTWSIGLEATFYLTLPFILINRYILWFCALVGALTWTLATHGIIDPDYYAYRLLPGTYVFFLIGIAIQQRNWWLFNTLTAFFLISALSLVFEGKFWLQFNAHLLVGAGFGCTTVPLLALLPRNRFDENLGATSYGTYLAHWIFVTALQSHYGEAWAIGVAVIGSVGSGWITYKLVEAPTLGFRQRLRSNVQSKIINYPVEIVGHSGLKH